VAFTLPDAPEMGYRNLDFFITVTKDPGNSLSQ